MINLQFFAEEEEAVVKGVDNEDKSRTEKLLSQEQVNDIISKRLTKEKAKWEKELNAKVAEEKRLAEMDAEQRKQAELEKRIAELEERERAIKLQENKMETENILKQRGLSNSFVDFVLSDDNETTLDKINKLEKAFKKAVADEVNNRIPTTMTNNGSEDSGSTVMSEKEFNKLPLFKQSELYLSNPDLYGKFLNKKENR